MEALRGRRRHALTTIWSTRGAAREPWLAGRAPLIVSAREIEQRCGASSHQGICAEAGPYPYVPAGELLAAELPRRVTRRGARSARPGPGSSESRVDLPDRRVRRRRRPGDPRAPLRRGLAGRLQGLRGGRRASADRPRPQPGRLPRRSQARGLLVLRREPCPRERLLRGARLRGFRRAGPRQRGRAVSDRASQAACDQLVALPLRGRIDSLGVAAAAAALLYGISRTRERAPRA